jgi:hypothetical protein
MSTAKYFQIWEDMRIQNRWHLGPPVDSQGQEINPWQFKHGRPLESEGQPTFHVVRPGTALDFTLTAFTIPLVHDRVVSLFERLGLLHEVQFLPARVEDRAEPYFILNVLRSIRCIDDERCDEVTYWLPEDGRPDMTGQYRSVIGMRVDPEKVGEVEIFRPWGWRVALVVSGRIKAAMEDERISGPMFIEV